MTVEELIQQLSQFDPKTEVLGEFDMDGDDFIVKTHVKKVYKGDGNDDSDYCDNNEAEYCIIKLDY